MPVYIEYCEDCEFFNFSQVEATGEDCESLNFSQIEATV